MLLRQLKLNNIRSYVDEIVVFPEGSVILSGDIGCGKSSILLAIEFALFGTSRPDLPAELLLRKGAERGWVELVFELEGQEILIKRNLKRDSRAIKQVAGYILIDGVKKDFTPVELKAEMIRLLGYPEDLVSKNKNFMYRYTVYTPQEEMKLILHENVDVRLDVLRKVFNIDKYKNIRENVQICLRVMRRDIAVLKTRLEPLEEQQEKLKGFSLEKEHLNKELVVVNPLLDSLRLRVRVGQEEIFILETEQKKYLELNQSLRTKTALLGFKMNSLDEQGIQVSGLTNKIHSLVIPGGFNKDMIKDELRILDLEKSEMVQKRSELQEKIFALQNNIKREREEISGLERQTSLIGEKEILFSKLQQEVMQLRSLEEKRVIQDELFLKTNELITKNETLLFQSKGLQEKIKDLDECPVCLQDVGDGHKEKISAQENNKILQAEEMLFNLRKKKREISDVRAELEDSIKLIFEKKNLFVKTQAELIGLKEKHTKIISKKEIIKSFAVQNNVLMREFSVVDNPEKLKFLQEESSKKQGMLELLNQKVLFDEQLRELSVKQELTRREVGLLGQEIEGIKNVLGDKRDVTEFLAQKRSVLDVLKEDEREKSVHVAQLQTKLSGVHLQYEELSVVITHLLEQKRSLVIKKDYYRWFDVYFLPLMYIIEKHVMSHIHSLFNQLFQEWFNILIEDDQIHARIDDSFSPLIEQNGYDVSFRNLSGGEKTSVALAYRLALNRVINDVVHTIKTKDLLILDEPTDGFSAAQLDKVREVLDRLNLNQTIIVSHETKIESFVDHVLLVRKEDHVSRVFS